MSDKKDWPKVAIIVLNWNGWRDTIECLESLKRLAYPSYDIIIVDNSSTDDSIQRIETWINTNKSKDLNVIILKNERNLGVAGGYNRGLRYALESGYEWVWLLDQDSLPDHQALYELLKTQRRFDLRTEILFSARMDKFAGIVYVPMRWQAKKWVKAFVSNPEKPIFINAQGFSGMLLKVSILQRLGFPRDDFFIDYDDYEFCLRATKAGIRTLYVPSAKILHSVGRLRVKRVFNRAILVTNHAPYRYYYMTRNKLYTHWRVHFDFVAGLWSLASALKLWIKILVFEPQKARKTWFIVRGIIDGLCGRMGKTIEPN